MDVSRRTFMKSVAVGVVGAALFRVIEIPKKATAFFSYYRNLWVQFPSGPVKFENGIFVTEDPAVVKMMRSHPRYKKTYHESREDYNTRPDERAFKPEAWPFVSESDLKKDIA
jgi:hypothetical protein